MGFFSLYKILKDIIRTIIGNKRLKLLFIIILIFIFLLIFNNYVKADSSIILTSYKNETYTLPSFDDIIENESDYDLFLIIKRKNSANNIYFICLKKSDATHLDLLSDELYLSFINYGRIYIYQNNTWELNNPWNTGTNYVNIADLIGSSIDLYNQLHETLMFTANINTFSAPFFDNSTQIQDGNPDGVFISPGDFTNSNNLYFHLLEVTTGLSNPDNSIYYYNDKTYLLNKDSNYYRTWLDPAIEGFYYYIPRQNLSLKTNTSYLYVLNNSSEQIQNSYGIYAEDEVNGIYDVIQSDTSGVITTTEEQTNIMRNLEEQQQNSQNSIQNIENTINDTTVSNSTENEIDTNLNFNNQNTTLNNQNSGFFSRLTNMFSSLIGYDLSQDSIIEIPLPNTQNKITLHSNILYNHVTGSLRLIINAYWLYIFSFYMWKFINKIYIAVSTGNILNTFSSSGEAITNDML